MSVINKLFLSQDSTEERLKVKLTLNELTDEENKSMAFRLYSILQWWKKTNQVTLIRLNRKEVPDRSRISGPGLCILRPIQRS